MGSKQLAKTALVLLCAAMALVAVAAATAMATTNETAWQRIGELAAEWELPVDTAGGELLYANAISPEALRPNRPYCVGGGCAGNGSGGYHGRGCNRVFGCHDN